MVLAFDKAGIEANYFEDWIKYLHQKFEANFQVVHVETSVNQHEARRENIDYQQFFGEIPFKHFEITGSSVDKRMVQFTKDINADMLIIFPRKDHLFTHLFSKSLTKSLSNKLHIPILALHFPGNM